MRSSLPPSAGRRVLVIAYCFPPHAAVGTLRTLRVVERLAADGWTVTVVTPAPASYTPGTPVDAALLARIPAGVRVVRTGALPLLAQATALIRRFRPKPAPSVAAAFSQAPAATGPRPAARLARLKVWFDQLTALPDDEVAWLLPAIVHSLLVVWREKPEVLYSSAPPWTGQVAAWVVASLTGRRWVADFRDPWARGPWREGRLPVVGRIVGGLERRAVRRAAAVVFTTHAAADEVGAFYGEAIAAKLHVVRNGCSAREFSSLTPQASSGRFVLLHTGSLYGARNPAPLFRAIAAAIDSGELSRDLFRLRLIGPMALAGVDLAAELRRLRLTDVVELVARLPRVDTLNEMVSADALLLIQPSHPLSIPAKTYEYLAAQRPILAMTDESETARIVREADAGVIVDPADEAALKRAVLTLVATAQTPRPATPARLYDGDTRAAEVAAILRQVAARGSTPTPAVEEIVLKTPVDSSRQEQRHV